MANLKDRKPADRWHGITYGASGAGKTHLLGTFPKPYIVDTDFGLETLVGKDIEYDEYYARLGESGAKDVWPKILARVEEFNQAPGEFLTFGVDSLTTITDVAVAHVVGKAGRGSIQLQDYQGVYDELTKLIIRLRRCPVNVVITAHEDVSRDENTGKLIIQPLVIGQKFPVRLPIFFNNIYCAIVDAKRGGGSGGERKLLVQSDGTRIAKTQAKNDDVTIPKSYDSIINHLNKVS